MSRSFRFPIRALAITVTAVMLLASPGFAVTVPPVPAAPAVPSSVAQVVPFTPVAVAYQEDFELGDGGYTTGGTSTWAYGSPLAPPVPAPGQGPTMWGTNLAGVYNNSECGWIESPAIDLSSYPAVPANGASGPASVTVSAARLLFRHWMEVENRYDGGIVQASSDGAAWRVIAPMAGYPSTVLTAAQACFGISATDKAYTSAATPAQDAWSDGEFDVSPFLGGALHLRWVFASDSSVVKRGWYVDDVLVQVGVGAAVSAQVAAAGPGGVAAPGAAFQPVSTVYAQDFEADNGGWTVSGATAAWEWGAPISPPTTLPGSLNVWGTRLGGDYLASECSTLTSPPIDVPGASPPSGVNAARLLFRMWRNLESTWDGVVLQASSDGSNWTRVSPYANGYDTALTSSSTNALACLGVTTGTKVWSGPSTAPKEDAWVDVEADLTAYMGKSVQLRFVFGSDPSVQKRGYYLDDVLLQLGAGVVAPTVAAGPGAACAPAPGWTVTGTNPSWCYGVPTTGPLSTRPGWATNLAGNYSSNECSAIVSPPIPTGAIPGLGLLSLTFEQYYKTASTDDGGIIQVSKNDGATWTTVTPIGGYPGSLGTAARACASPGATSLAGVTGSIAAYEFREVRLSAYQGETIRVRFVFGSGASLESDGWYVRNIQVTRSLVPVPIAARAPTAVDLAPLLKKANPDLVQALQAGQKANFDVIVLGQPHEGVNERQFADRAEALRVLGIRSAGFMGAVQELAGMAGATLLESWVTAPAVHLRGDLPLLLALASRDDVRAVEMDKPDAVHLVEPEIAPDDAVAPMNSEGRNMIQAEDIWALGFRGEGIKIAMVDTGINPNHEAFKFADGSSRVTAWKDWVNNQAAPYDDQGHGTHVAGTAAGSSVFNDPTFGVFQETGVAPNAILMVSKFLDSAGSGSFTNGINALNWAYNNSADITSNSWGSSCSASLATLQTVRTLTDLGMLNVFAAGNSGPGSGSIGGPGCSESALTVGAVDKNGVIASFSSRGPCSDPDTGTASRICPDVVTKGYLVRSSAGRTSCSLCSPTGYIVLNGTSMATPHTAGAAVLAEQMKRYYTGTGWDTAARAEESVFKLTALDLGAAGEDNTYGWGLPQLLNIYALLSSTSEANVVHSFSISAPTVRLGESTRLSFTVRNLGGAIATGDFLATLTDPQGGVQTLKSSHVALGLLDGEGATTTVTVSGSVLPGTYTFHGAFAYSWTNETSGDVVTGVIDRTGTFDVKRVFIAMSLDGLAATATPAELQAVSFTAANTGNEAANNVTVEVTVPDKYQFVPGANFNPTDNRTRYSDPRPDTVREDKNFGRITLIFNVGSLPEGSSFGFTMKLLPTAPDNYRFLSVAKFKDGSGNGFSQGALTLQTVGLPAAPGAPQAPALPPA